MIESVGIISLLMIGAGCYFIYPPLGLLVPGTLLFILTCLAAINQSVKVEKKKG